MSNPFKVQGQQEEKKEKLDTFGDLLKRKPEEEKKDILGIFVNTPESQPEKKQYLFGNNPKPSGYLFGNNIFAPKQTPEPQGNIFSNQSQKGNTNLFTNIELPKEEKKAEPEEKKVSEDLDLKEEKKEEKKEEPKVEQKQIESSKNVVKVESSYSDSRQIDSQSSDRIGKEKKKTKNKKDKNKVVVQKESGKMEKQKKENERKIYEEKRKVEQMERDQELLKKTLDDFEVQIKANQQQFSENKQELEKKDQLSKLLKTLKQQKTQQTKINQKLLEQISGKKQEIAELENKADEIEKQLEDCEELRSKVVAVNIGILRLQQKYQVLKVEVDRGDNTHLKQLREISKEGRHLLEERNKVNEQVMNSGLGNHITTDEHFYQFEKFGQVDESKPAVQKEEQNIENKQVEKDQKLQKKQEKKPKKEQKENKIDEQPKCEPEKKKDEQNKIFEQKIKEEKPLIKQELPKNSEKSEKEKIKEEPSSKIQQPIKEEPKQQQKIVESIVPKAEKIKTDTKIFKIAAQMSDIFNKINERQISDQNSSQQIMETVSFKRQKTSILKQKAREYEQEMEKIRDIPDIMEDEKQSIVKSEIIKKGVDQLIKNEQQTNLKYTILFQIAFDRQLEEKQNREKDRMQIQQAIDDFELQPKMKVMYENSVDNVRERDPHRLRFLQIFHKYLNQLRILIELSNISNEELMANHFDRNIYIELISRKTQLFEENKLQGDISENMFDTEKWITFMDKIDEIQVQLAPMEDNFDQTYVKGLYRIPQEVLSNTKQQLFDVTLKKQLNQYSEEVEKLKQGGRTMEKQLQEIKAEKQKLKALIKQKEKKHEILLDKHNKELKKEFFPGRQENNLLNRSQFEPQYNVIVKNQTKIIAQYQQLNDDVLVKDLKQRLEGLHKERMNEKQEYEQKKREYYRKVAEMKKLAMNSVYMGDSAKVKANPKVQFLQAQLKELQLKLSESQKSKSQNQSKISQQSQIRVSLVLQ